MPIYEVLICTPTAKGVATYKRNGYLKGGGALSYSRCTCAKEGALATANIHSHFFPQDLCDAAIIFLQLAVTFIRYIIATILKIEYDGYLVSQNRGKLAPSPVAGSERTPTVVVITVI